MIRRNPVSRLARPRGARLLLALGLAAVGALAAACERSQAPAAAPQEGSGDPAEIVARINGRAITSAELDDWIKEDLLRRELASKRGSELYEFRIDALERMLLEEAVADEAERRDLEEEALVDAELEALGPVSAADVAAFYDKHQARFRGATLEQMADRIEAFLQRERREQARGVIRDRADVAVLLEAPRANVDASGPSIGPDDAGVTIVEFTDYQCPFCQRAEPTVREIVRLYPEDVRLVVRHLPLESIHPLARGAAAAAVCAEEQGRFWEFHETLFANQKALGQEQLAGYAEELELDMDAFNACLESPATQERVESDVQAAREVGVSGTPAFFVNGILLTGAKSLDEFQRVIDRELGRS